MRKPKELLKEVKTGLGVVLMGLATGVHPSHAADMTAGSILEKMELKERYAYVSGIVEGMAYARFRKDTIAAGQRVETGSVCIRNWYYAGDGSTYDRIETEFRRNAQHMPSVIIAVMLKKECGE